ncbi:MAG: ABC transporter ATP-binding protein [Scytonema sp. PMC 1069.18]|nr:ABC transporter ATP-binding protein [Scytonema sp. PMC 1069.18]MEC4884137.1 ABC transporter ATP-binding protein [Scytonema sp. PMC 1070.18]
MSYLRLENITKSFGSFISNNNISFSVEAGKIHAILGENGAGKTTLMNIISGLYQPDNGKIYIQDKLVTISSSQEAIQLGIGMIHQHFMLVPQLTVTENIILGRNNKLHLNLSQKQQEIAALSQTYGLEVNPSAKVADLPVGTQQRVEILKVLYRKARLLILDEPTAVLTRPEVVSLIKILRQLAAAGNTIIFIGHKLDEIINLCDTVTVLRKGKVIATTTKETTPKELAELMVGREVSLQLNKSPTLAGDVVLSVQNLYVEDDRGVSAVNDVSFELREGEILGLAGVDGNGQRELADSICGLRNVKRGKIEMYPSPNSSLQEQYSSVKHKRETRFLGETGFLTPQSSLTDSYPQGRKGNRIVGYIPEDRQKMGLVLQSKISQNLILKVFKNLPFCRRALLQQESINNNAMSAMEEFDIRTTGVGVKVSQLSGGNQQKVVLARELAGKPALIVAMQPTRGLDVGAMEAVQLRLLAERERGAAILYISTELEEIMAMSDRIAVIYRGEFVGVLDAQTATVEEIGLLMGGAS